jgi:hypothetical protein
MGLPGAVVPIHAPGEVALCLSYFSTYNAKRFRGRNYIPYSWIWAAEGSNQTVIQQRPSAAEMQHAMDLWNLVYKPVDHNTNWDWVLKSRVDKAFKPITDVWVDNEWDTIRSRGLRGDTRITAKT